MSVVDLDKVDAVGVDRREKALRLMISDHMDWEDEGKHLDILQEKINLYLEYIGNGQYVEEYGETFYKFFIDIFFQIQITEGCVCFLEAASKQLEQDGIFIIPHFSYAS